MRIFNVFSLCTLAFAHLFEQTAHGENPVLGPSELYSAGGSTAAFAGGGTAIATDISVVDANPAGLTLSKMAPGYFLVGEAGWSNHNLRTMEVGILDNASSPLAAGFKARRTTEITGAKVDRFSVGLSEQVGEVPVFFGLAGDFDVFEKPQSSAQKEKNYRLRTGLIYQVTPSFFVGAKSGGWFDRSKGAKQNHTLGMSWAVSSLGALSADAEFAQDQVSSYIGSAIVSPLEWLDVQAGYGYEVETSRHRVAGSIALRSEKFRVYYSVAKPSDSSLPLRQSIGLAFNAFAATKD